MIKREIINKIVDEVRHAGLTQKQTFDLWNATCNAKYDQLKQEIYKEIETLKQSQALKPDLASLSKPTVSNFKELKELANKSYIQGKCELELLHGIQELEDRIKFLLSKDRGYTQQGLMKEIIGE